ncbi:P-loop containing nucleoside triphosphate hydrolase protein [Aspergillus venezuelensis]
MEPVYQTLTARALALCNNRTAQTPPDAPFKRVIIALSGPPGSGKSTIAATVISRLNALATRPFAIALPMDGFHYPKKYLDSMDDPAKAYARRGAHWTFDAKGVLTLIKALALSPTSGREREIITAPQFNHAVGDPVQGGIVVSPEISLVIVEGNYLAFNLPPWSEIGQYVDESWFVEVDGDVARRRLAQRHLDSGIEATMEAALNRVEANDIVNGEDIRRHLVEPQIVVWSVDES